jgi:cysteine protease ATG4
MQPEEDVAEWDLMSLEEPPPGYANKTAKFKNIFLHGKSRVLASLYNIYRRYPTEPPEFTLSPVYLLGNYYHCDDTTINQFTYLNHGSDDESGFALKLHNPPHVAHFLRDFQCIIWFSYRKDFPPLGPAQLTSDIGWGCMLRTGQMILAQTLVYHLLGRDWRLSLNDTNQPFSIYRQILRLFTDSPLISSPYSVHNIVMRNKKMVRLNNPDIVENSTTNPFKAEPWFAPSAICRVLKSLVHNYGPNSLTMYVPTDPVVYMDKVVQLCTQRHHRHPTNKNANKNANNSSNNNNNNSGTDADSNNNNNNQQHEEHASSTDDSSDDQASEPSVPWRSLFILIPMRLGVDKINPIYFETIFACLRMPQSVGIIGGKPKQSFWFVGYQDEHLIYLDPHIVQESVQPNTKFSDETYHCSVPQKIHISEVDPSLAVGFYCHTKEEFDNLCNSIEEMSKTSTPIFTIEQHEPVYDSEEDSS